MGIMVIFLIMGNAGFVSSTVSLSRALATISRPIEPEFLKPPTLFAPQQSHLSDHKAEP